MADQLHGEQSNQDICQEAGSELCRIGQQTRGEEKWGADAR
ncbi:MAG TPA: hypothetical protein VGA76_01180 [Candidatus Dormibacteraeota bacterium]